MIVHIDDGLLRTIKKNCVAYINTQYDIYFSR